MTTRRAGSAIPSHPNATTRSAASRRPDASPGDPGSTLAVWRARALVGLAALGAAISAYLTWVHYSGALALCAGVGNCETVQASEYAVVAGVPVALLGLLLYLAVLGLCLWRLWTATATPYLVSLGLFGLAFAGVLYSGYLTYLELYVIDAICPWCVSSAVIVTSICALALWDRQDLQVSESALEKDR